MTIDWWAFGLQAVNVLILVWLLSAVFWRPVAAVIARRGEAVRATLDEAKGAKAEADAALAEITKARAGIAAEREAVLAAAKATAETATKTALADARDEAEKLIAAARLAIERETEAAEKDSAATAARLSVDIAAKLLRRLHTPSVQAAFLDLLIEAIDRMPPNTRAALAGTSGGIDLVSAGDLEDADKAMIGKAVKQALGGSPRLTFVTDPELIAGLELRTAHFELHNSWRSDLARILEDLKHAA
jgi:F-type H+-transporting ATPase subunit b